MITALLARLQLWGAVALGVVIGLVTLCASVRRGARREFEAARTREQLKAAQDKRRQDDELAQLGDGDLDQRFKRWVRR